MIALSQALAEYERVWGSLRPEGVKPLRPGASPETVRQTLAGAGLPAPQEIIDWFGWHNGTDDSWLSRLPSVWHLLSLDEALREREEIRQERRRMIADFGPGEMPDEWYELDFHWHRSWLPVLIRDSSYVVAELKDGGDEVPLRSWAPEAPEEANEEASTSMASVIEHWTVVLRCCTRLRTDTSFPHWEIDEDRRPPAPESIPWALK